MLYHKNTKYLFSCSKRLREDIGGAKKISKVATFTEELENFALGGDSQYLLHSVYNFEREMARTVQTIDPHAQTIILLGIGNGKILDYLHQKCKNIKHLIIIEPLQEVFQTYLKRYDIFVEFSKFEQVSLLINCPEERIETDLSNSLQKHPDWQRSFSFVTLMNYRMFFSEYKEKVNKCLLERLRNFRVQINTFEKFREEWVINFWKTFDKSRMYSEELMEIFNKAAVVIVSAGPSLSKNIHLLEQIKDSAIVIAVGSAMTILDKHGIVPHLRVSIDPSMANVKLVKAIADTTVCPMIFGTTLAPEILDIYKGTQLLMNLQGASSLNDYIMPKLKDWKTGARSGFSVANIVFDFAVQMGAKEVIMVGQDLCYTNEKVHAEGSWDDRDTGKIRKEMLVKNIYGEEVYTDKAFWAMKNIFETLVKVHQDKNIRFINATEGGLPIEGMEDMMLQEVIFLHGCELKKEYARMIQQCVERSKESHKLANDEERKIEIYQETLTEIEKIFKYYKRIMDIAGEWSQEKGGEKELYSHKVLQRMQKNYKKFETVEFFNRVVKPFYEDKNKIYKLLEERSDKKESAVQKITNLLRRVAPLEGFLEMNRELILKNLQNHEVENNFHADK